MALVLGMPQPDASRLHPFFAQNDPTNDSGEQQDRPRKRQKSSSPACDDVSRNPEIKQDERWIDQLNEAAEIASKPVTEYSRDDAVEEQRNSGNDGLVIPCQPIDSAPNEANTRLPDESSAMSAMLLEHMTADESRASSAAPSPPKKMLKVRADGKLSSPKKDIPGNSRVRKSRRTKQQIEFEETGVIIIKYGKRKKARLEMATKINALLAGEAVLIDGQVMSKPIKPSVCNQKPTHPFFTGDLDQSASTTANPSDLLKADDSLRPTHPFFSGEATRSTKDRSRSQQRANDAEEARKPPSISPRRMRVNSKPPGLEDLHRSKYEGALPVFGTDHAKLLRFPGAKEALWPPSDLAQADDKECLRTGVPEQCVNVNRSRKLKDRPVGLLPQEDVLMLCASSLSGTSIRSMSRHDDATRTFRRPQRQVMSGEHLQSRIRSRLGHDFILAPIAPNIEADELSLGHATRPPALKALARIYNRIGIERSAFDRFECENRQWAQKYAPITADDVLQSGKEAIFIRDWLQSLTVSSVTMQTGNVTASKQPKLGKKKRKRREGLDDFLVSSDEDDAEAASVCVVPDSGDQSKSGDRRSKHTFFHDLKHRPGGRLAHAAVLSGPSGCGKSATVYAVAKELGFEIFEINAGSRRSGKDILERVGNMVHNHLVTNDATAAEGDMDETAEQSKHDEKLQDDLDSGRQKTMGSFFNLPTRDTKPKKPKPKQDATQPKPAVREPKAQKQSLILIEEVDVLFEDDKPFWSTIFDLIISTRRPVLMTCNDEELLPVKDMDLHGIFRLTPAPMHLAIDYLLLVACCEGHLLQREAVSTLYKAKKHDLRATMTELQIHCQMAVGDRKGGLEWMLLDQPRTEIETERQPMRVVSEGTYQTGMGWLSDASPFVDSPETSTHISDNLLMACNEWDLDINELVLNAYDSSDLQETSRQSTTTLDQLKELEQVLEGHCIADLFPAAELRQSKHIRLDTTQPSISLKQRGHFIEGVTLAQADVLEDQTGLTSCISTTLHVLARHLWSPQDKFACTTSIEKAIVSQPRKLSAITSSTIEDDLIAALVPLTVAEKFPQICVIDAPISVVATDVAPYVRSIASYDLRLEQQRHALSGVEGKGTKARKTRASLAALEGGSKASTRRERWWKRDVDLGFVVKTAGVRWEEAAGEWLAEHTDQSENVEERESSEEPVAGEYQNEKMDMAYICNVR